MNEKLLPCPFGCGREHVKFMTHTFHNEVVCVSCGCNRTALTKADAIAAWNHRPPVPDGYVLIAIGEYVELGKRAAQQTPEGWRVVPKEPTQEMIVSGCDPANFGDMAGRYKAMLDAAPSQEEVK